MQTFQPARVTEIRKALGLTRPQLATKLGVSRQLVWCWEKGRHVPGSTPLMRMARLTGANLESFFTNSPDGQYGGRRKRGAA